MGEATNQPPEDGGEVSYYRNQIVKVKDTDSLIKIGRKKEDLTFGVKMGREEGGINRNQKRELRRLDAVIPEEEEKDLDREERHVDKETVEKPRRKRKARVD